MLRLLTIRVLLGVVTLLAASVLFFAAAEILGVDYATASAGRYPNPEIVETIRESQGLYRPAYLRYFDWLGHVLQADLGYSWANERNVASVIRQRISNTLFLAVMTALFAIPLSLALGLIAAAKHNTFIDRMISILALTTLSVPEYAIAYILMAVLAVKLQLFPAITVTFNYQSLWGQFHTISLPALTLGLAMMPNIIRLSRAAVMNVLSRPYIDMARLKGLPAHRVLIYHALPHAVGPIINIAILGIANIITGTFIIEIVFAYPGIGQLMIDAVGLGDMPIILACGLIFTVTYVVLVLLADLVAILSNPRLHPVQPPALPPR